MSATKKSTRRKTPAKDAAPEVPESILMDGSDDSVIRVLDQSAVFFIEMRDGSIHTVAADRVSNLFRRDGRNYKYYMRGLDTPPADSASYVTIEEIEALREEIDPSSREQAKAALEEDENRQDKPIPSTQLGEINPPIRD